MSLIMVNPLQIQEAHIRINCFMSVVEDILPDMIPRILLLYPKPFFSQNNPNLTLIV